MLIGKIVKKALQQYWRLSRGLKLGVKAVIFDREGCILLVRPAEVADWRLPEAEVRRGEAGEDALQRMLDLDLSITLEGPPAFMGLSAGPASRPDGHWVLLAVRHWRTSEASAEGRTSRLEMRPFSAAQLPAVLAPGEAALVLKSLAPGTAIPKG